MVLLLIFGLILKENNDTIAIQKPVENHLSRNIICCDKCCWLLKYSHGVDMFRNAINIRLFKRFDDKHMILR